jgi:hypothetical protein
MFGCALAAPELDLSHHESSSEAVRSVTCRCYLSDFYETHEACMAESVPSISVCELRILSANAEAANPLIKCTGVAREAYATCLAGCPREEASEACLEILEASGAKCEAGHQELLDELAECEVSP